MELNLTKLIPRFAGRDLLGVIHVGAHVGQERSAYEKLGLKNQVWIEPDPDTFQKLMRSLPDRPGVRAIQAAAGASESTLPLLRLDVEAGEQAGVANSLLAPSEAARASMGLKEVGDAERVRVAPLDSLLNEAGITTGSHRLLVVDTQGYELECLRGATSTLEGVDLVVCEVSSVPVYEGGCLIADVDAFLAQRGFVRVYTVWGVPGHGDALYARKDRMPILPKVALALAGAKEKGPSANQGGES